MQLLESFQKSFPTLSFPPLPEWGDFELRQVLESPYFFNWFSATGPHIATLTWHQSLMGVIHSLFLVKHDYGKVWSNENFLQETSLTIVYNILKEVIKHGRSSLSLFSIDSALNAAV